MWWLIGWAQFAAWTAVCMWAAPGFGRRFWAVLIVGGALNLSGFAEGLIRQKDHDHRAATLIEAAP